MTTTASPPAAFNSPYHSSRMFANQDPERITRWPPASYLQNDIQAQSPQQRKRRAPSPTYGSSQWINQPDAPAKKRRPNLANGFSGLSLAASAQPGTSYLPTYQESQAADHARKLVDEDDDPDFEDNFIGPTKRDIEIEEISSPRRKKGLIPKLGRTGTSGSISSTTTSGSDPDDTLPRLRRTQHASAIEQPDVEEVMPGEDVEVEDVTIPSRGKKRRSSSISLGEGRGGKNKRVRDEMDVEMAGLDEISRVGRGRSQWYEPEKDRIIYTALSSRSSSSERHASPPIDAAQLVQPGSNGFTISPSMLTRILAAQRDSPALPRPQREMGMVLYRPMGIQPGDLKRGVDDLVKEWQGRMDSERFEILEDGPQVEDLDLDLDQDAGAVVGDDRQAGDMDIDM